MLLAEKRLLKVKAITILLTVTAAVVLPQLFHLVGVVLDVGPLLGKFFLPMHLPVIIGAFLAGPMVGLFSGFLSPLISFMISGMPAQNAIGFMMIELMGIGITAGFLKKINMPVFFKLLIAQITGRLLRIFAVVFAIYILRMNIVIMTEILNIFYVGISGIIFQWISIPIFMHRVKGFERYYG